MSKKITHEQVERVFEKIVWLTNRLANWNGDDLEYLEKEYNYLTNSQVVWNFLKQQKKQDKLLELYKRLLEEGAFIPNLKGHRTLSEIKELENDK